MLYCKSALVLLPDSCGLWQCHQSAGHCETSEVLPMLVPWQCFIVSTVDALRTPMINAAMVMCDRHFGGINYPRGGVGKVALELVEGLKEHGGEVLYKANVTNILLENGSAVRREHSHGASMVRVVFH